MNQITTNKVRAALTAAGIPAKSRRVNSQGQSSLVTVVDVDLYDEVVEALSSVGEVTADAWMRERNYVQVEVA